MKTLFVTFLFFPYLLAAQHNTFSGYVTDEMHKNIPFCIVHADNGTTVYTDDNGKFTISTDSVHRLTFFCPGYEKKELSLTSSTYPVEIQLRKPNIDLKEVIVMPKKEKIRIGILGKKRIKLFEYRVSNYKRKNMDKIVRGSAYAEYGDEYGIFLKADSSKEGILKDIHVYVTPEGIPSTQFRIHVYDEDSMTLMPLHDITDSNVIVHATKGSQWVVVDLSTKRIPVKEGVFVSVEWISGHGNSDSSWHYKASYSNEQNGQVIGMTYSYKDPLTVFRSLNNSTWRLFPINLNLMIYGTYTYVKQ